MKCKTSKKWNAGFTLVEILAATAIVVILLAVGTVSVVRYAKLLQLTELDNAAREIYMAAEHQAALLAGSGRLEGQVDEARGEPLSLPAQAGVTPLAAGGTGESSSKTVYIKHSGSGDSTLDALVPEGTIDPGLREGSFYVVYDVNEKSGAGSVTDVFYAKETDTLAGFDTSYADWKTLSRQDRLSKKLMFGYYGGEAATSGGTETLETPELHIENGEELKVILTYSAPVGETRTHKVILTYGGKEAELALTDSVNGNPPLTGGKKTYTWVLDTLKDGGHKFSHWVENPNLGGDFTVTATIESNTAVSDPAMATGNSLFADNSDGETAYIANLRHLQNLDRDHSGVAGKTAAVQTEDIDCGTSMFTDYKFKPIVNNELKSYCGSYAANGADSVTHAIKGLKVTADSAKDKNGAGLFATAPKTLSGLNLVDAVVAGNAGQAAGALAGTVASGAQVSDVHMINAVVKAENAPAGALAGSATNASFDGCQVYWEMDIQSELRGQLTNEDGMPKYQITGSSAGGLAGELDGGSVTNCLAATLVKGSDAAGGLVGQASGTVKVDNSYADCYLTAPTAAGLIGTAGGTAPEFENVYSAGFIYDTKTSAAGLCNGKATANRAYSAMRYENTAKKIVPLADGVTAGDGSHCYFLQYTNGSGGMSFKDMTEASFVDKMNEGAATGTFQRKGQDDSSPYNLLEGMGLTPPYPFPGLNGLPHYGDWASELARPTLVYYELYKDGTYGFFGGGVDCLKNDQEILEDGYAVAIPESIKSKVDIKFTYYTQNGDQKNFDQTYHSSNGQPHERPQEVTYDEKTYSLTLLPKEIPQGSDYASEDFYQLLGFQVGSDPTAWAAYSPHFAKTGVALPDLTEEQAKAALPGMGKRVQAYVRTPRHLRALSQFEAYAHGGINHAYTYIQELDLDYATDWTGGDSTQDPIGKYSASFNGTYDGQCHTIRGVQFRRPEGENYVGLFGVSSGRLLNIAYLLDGKDGKDGAIKLASEGSGVYVGGLVGRNNNEVYNCAVAGLRLQVEVSKNVTLYAGGLVGVNEGLIRSCSADVARMDTAGYSSSIIYAGGLAGLNGSGGEIRVSYAVGRVSSKADSASEGRVCGFVGVNWGKVTDSYAAVWLEASGAGVETYGFCGEKRGTQSNNYFVNDGNFNYRGDPYNASYATNATTKATPITYSALTGKDQPLTGMALNAAAVNGNVGKDGKPEEKFPYPGVVRNAAGAVVHYGCWPEMLELGDMGVYYWEKMELPGGSGSGEIREIYSVSMLKVEDIDGVKKVSKISTLSETHSDGGVVVDYGYGYYTSNEFAGKVHVDTDFLFYTANGKPGSQLAESLSDGQHFAEKSLEEVDNALNQLMSEYTFHSYRTFVPNPNPNELGNFAEGVGQGGIYAKDEHGPEVNGRIVLTPDGADADKDKGGKYYFEINPHFADALALSQENSGGLKYDDPVIVATPGTKDNPYEVRAMGQLSAINWNSENLDTKTVLVGLNSATKDFTIVGRKFERNTHQFPYLSYVTDVRYDRDYVWKQTHDIDGNKGLYTPIAECYAVRQYENLTGWFGGEFDGGSYTIQDVNIQGQTATMTGLFGGVYNGTLKNIVLHSSDGKGFVTSNFTVEDMFSSCYYIGALAGFAASQSDSSVVNCSASGYTVCLNTYNAKDSALKEPLVGGSGAGGLLGASNMKLENCSAVNTVRILGNANNEHGNDNIRAGGLVGIAQNSITNCYAGGEITVGGTMNPDGSWSKDGQTVRVKALNGLYLGGIVGGSYFKKFDVSDGESIGNDSASITLSNCYSYVTLPSQEKTKLESTTKQDYGRYEKLAVEDTGIRGLYALGGLGDNIYTDSARCTIDNCYYLESEVMRNNPNGFRFTQYDGGSGHIGGSSNRKTFVLNTDLQNRGQRKVNVGTSPYSVGTQYDGNTIKADAFGGKDPGDTSINGTRYYYNRSDNGKAGLLLFESKYNAWSVRWDYVFRGWLSYNDKGEPVLETNPDNVYDWVSKPGGDPLGLTYPQLAGDDPIPVKENQKINALLSAFSRVTADTANGSSTNEYSYGSAAHLNGLQYPFPTILTRTEEGRLVHVHYGNWPLNGVERVTGSAPIRMNLFSSYTATETLTASSNIPSDGDWTAEVTDESVASVKCEPAPDRRTCVLTVTGNKVGDTSVTVTYTAGGVSYPVNIAVQVTARLRVNPQETPVYLFPGADADIPLALCNEMGQEVTAERREEMQLKLLEDKSTCGLPGQLLKSAELRYREDEGYYYLHLEAVDEPVLAEGQTALDGLLPVSAAYTYKGLPEDDYDTEVSSLAIQLQALPEPESEPKLDGEVTVLEIPEEITLGEGENAPLFKAELTGAEVTEPADSVVVREGNTLRLAGYTPGTEVTLTLKLKLTRQGAGDGPAQELTCTQTLTVTIPKGETEKNPEGETQAEALPEDATQAAELPENETEPAAEPPKDKTEGAAELPEDETQAAELPENEIAAG